MSRLVLGTLPLWDPKVPKNNTKTEIMETRRKRWSLVYVLSYFYDFTRSALAKQIVCKGIIAKALVSWQLMTQESVQAGNRASKTGHNL